MTEAVEANSPIHPVKKVAIIGGKLAVGGLIGYAAAKTIPPLFWMGVKKMNPYAHVGLRKYTPRHTAIGQATILAGGLMQNPVMMGIGGGLVASDSDNSVLRKQEWNRNKSKSPSDFNMTRYNVPNWLPSKIRWQILSDFLAEMVTKPTYNAQKKEWIPAGREHPEVIEIARKIARQNVLDGHNKIAVLKAIQRWVQDNVRYVYDPRWLDTFSHPYITLRKGVEDCDGQAMLAASLGEALGIPMVLVLVGQKDNKNYNHILSAGIVDKKLVPIETIPLQGERAKFGYMPPHIHKKIIPLI